MRRIALVIGLCALAAASTAGAAADSAAERRASLFVVDLQPLVVGGAGFADGERVQLMLSWGEGQVWRVKLASARGSLSARFGVSVGACGRFAVQAFGSRGSRARVLPFHGLDCGSPTDGSLPDLIGLER